MAIANNMAKVYANLIKHGFKTLNDVPAALREAVEELLAIES